MDCICILYYKLNLDAAILVPRIFSVEWCETIPQWNGVNLFLNNCCDIPV